MTADKHPEHPPGIDDRDWSTLSIGEQRYQLEVEGYVVLPNLLDTDHIARLKTETALLETTPVDYSEKQRGHTNAQWAGGEITQLIAHSPTIAFLKEVLGDDIVFMTYAYARSEPGHPGISLHTDGQPYGSKIFGYEGSCPVLLRVLYYLDDLTPQVSPFRVVPKSHLSLHADGNPYQRFESHPEEVMVTAQAGSAVIINHKVFHGNYPNTGTTAREMLAIAYRPAWAGPINDVDSWTVEQLATLPESVRPFITNRNTRHADLDGGNKPDNMKNDAPGISPTRWLQ